MFFGDNGDILKAVMTIFAHDNFQFIFGLRIANADAHQESIELALGKRIGPGERAWVLRSDHKEGMRKFVRFSIEANATLCHRFQER